MDLISILNPGWPVRWSGKTLFVSPFGPLAWARLDQMLRARYLADSKDADQAMQDIRNGVADYGSQWAAQYVTTEAGALLLYTAALSTRQPWITPVIVAEMSADPVTAAQLISATRLSAPPPTTEKAGQDTDWGEVIGTVLRLRPTWTFDDIARLSDAQLRFIFDRAIADNAGERDEHLTRQLDERTADLIGTTPETKQGEWSLDDIEPTPAGGQ